MKKSDYTWTQLFKDYWLLLKGRRLKFTIHTILRYISNLVPFATAYLLGMIIDFFANYKLGQSLTKFYLFVALIALLGSFQVLLRFFAKLRMQTIAAEVRKETRTAAISKLMDLELKWHEKEETGSKIQKINSGGESIYQGIYDFSNQGVTILAELFGSLILFLVLDPRYLIYAAVYSSIYLAGERYFNRKLNYWQNQLNKIKEKVSGKMHESASNLLTIKSLGLKQVFRGATNSYERKYYKTWLKTKEISQVKAKTIKTYAALGYASFILFIGLDVVNSVITVGSIFVFTSYFGKLKGALDLFTNNINNFIETKTSVGRFMKLFGAEILERNGGAFNISKDWKTIEFRDIDFRYKDKKVLKGFDLTIKKNEKIGIVGKSGCGKSTIVKLLLGLYKPQSGKIIIGNKELNKYKHKSVTDNISVVLQDSEMFNSSLLNNVTISSTKKELAIFKKAAKVAQLQPLIKKLPKGLNTIIGEKGYKVSGGERQRIGLARALYKNSPILVLDEATSALDSKTEDLIQKGIEKLKDRTWLIIAHRLSTLKNVNKIIVMDKGKVIEEGTFKELIKQNGKFKELYELQRRV